MCARETVIPPPPALNIDTGCHGQPGCDTMLETAAWAVITAGCGPSVFCFSARGLHGVTAHLAPALPWKQGEWRG